MKKKYYCLLLITLVISLSFAAEPPNWEQITGAQFSMVLYGEINLNNQVFGGSGNNLAAAFGPGGEADCRSIGIWYPPSTSHDGYWYFTIVGDTANEEIIFKIYEEVADSIYTSLNSVLFQSNLTLGSSADPFLIEMPTWVTIDPPQNVSVSLIPSFSLVIVSWTAVAEAQSYFIYAGDDPDIDTTPGTHVGHVSGTSWFDSIGEKRFYTVTSSSEP